MVGVQCLSRRRHVKADSALWVFRSLSAAPASFRTSDICRAQPERFRDASRRCRAVCCLAPERDLSLAGNPGDWEQSPMTERRRQVVPLRPSPLQVGFVWSFLVVGQAPRLPGEGAATGAVALQTERNEVRPRPTMAERARGRSDLIRQTMFCRADRYRALKAQSRFSADTGLPVLANPEAAHRSGPAQKF